MSTGVPSSGGSPAAHSPQPMGREAVVTRLERLGTNIGFEFELIAHRMTWLVVSQSFLFSAYVLALCYVKPAAGVGADTVALTKVIWLVPTLGIVASVFVLLAVFGAHSVIYRLKNEREVIECGIAREHGVSISSVPTGCWQHRIGNWPPVVVPVCLIVMWAYLLVVV